MTLEAAAPLCAAFVALKALLQTTDSGSDESSAVAVKALSDAEATALREFEEAAQRCLAQLGDAVLATLKAPVVRRSSVRFTEAVDVVEVEARPDPCSAEQKKERKKQKQAEADKQNQESVKLLFNQFDTDGDGLISCEDFKETVLLGLGLGDTMTDEEIDKLVVSADEDKDGFINLAEFTHWLFSSSGKTAMKIVSGKEDEEVTPSNGEATVDEGQSKIEKSLRHQLVEIRSELEESQAQVVELKKKSDRQAKAVEDKAAQELRDMDEELESTHEFWRCVAKSSASPQLDECVDLETAELLGNGKYAVVMKAKSRTDDSVLVVKMMSVRWTHVATKEWHQASLLKECPFVVTYNDAVLHADKDKGLARLVQEGLDSGKIQLPGRTPGATGSRPDLPDKHMCLLQEFMNHGSVQDWMDKGNLDTRRMLAVMRSVAAALSYMHQQGLTHNDIKPENIMLKQEPNEPFIRIKLGDLGLAKRALDRSADFSQYGMTVFCMLTNEHFGTRKFQEELIDPLGAEATKIVKAQLKALDSEDGEMDDTMTSLLKLPGQLKKIFREKVNMAQLEEWPPLQGWTFQALESSAVSKES